MINQVYLFVDKKDLSKKEILKILKKADFKNDAYARMDEDQVKMIESCIEKLDLGNTKDKNGIYLKKNESSTNKIDYKYHIIIKYTPIFEVFDRTGNLLFGYSKLPSSKMKRAKTKEFKIRVLDGDFFYDKEESKSIFGNNLREESIPVGNVKQPYSFKISFTLGHNEFSDKADNNPGISSHDVYFYLSEKDIKTKKYYNDMDFENIEKSTIIELSERMSQKGTVFFYDYSLEFHPKFKDLLFELRKIKENFKSHEFYQNQMKIEYENLLKKLDEDEIKEKKEVSSFISNFVNDYDTDNNGKLDILENDGFAKLLKSNQSKIIEVDKSYIQKFVKLSLYIKTKSKNLQKTFTLIKDAQELKEINNLHLVFESQYHSYAVTIFESFKMMLSLVKDDLITFYETYEKFDQLKIFESNWESEVSKSLSDIKELNVQTVQQLISISKQIQSMEESIVTGLKISSEQITASIDEMNNSLTKELEGVNDKLWWNNVFQTIQIYQNRKTNQLLGKDYKLKLKQTDRKYLT